MENPGFRLERRACSLTDVAVVRLAWCLALALAIAVLHPAPLFTAALCVMLGMAALLVAMRAALVGEPLRSRDLGRWDVSAILYLLSRSFGRFVDQDELRNLLGT